MFGRAGRSSHARGAFTRGRGGVPTCRREEDGRKEGRLGEEKSEGEEKGRDKEVE